MGARTPVAQAGMELAKKYSLAEPEAISLKGTFPLLFKKAILNANFLFMFLCSAGHSQPQMATGH